MKFLPFQRHLPHCSFSNPLLVVSWLRGGFHAITDSENEQLIFSFTPQMYYIWHIRI